VSSRQPRARRPASPKRAARESSSWRLIVAIGTLLFGRRRARKLARAEQERIVPPGSRQPRAEFVVVALLGIASLFAVAFVVTYAEFDAVRMPNELLGVCLGGAFLFIALALTVVAKRLVVTEELEDEYEEEHPTEQRELIEIIHQSGSRITRKRMLVGAAGVAGGALGVAALTPALSLGPLWYTAPLARTPWRRGIRLVDESNNPVMADGIDVGSFYTAFPEGADKEELGAPVVVVRLHEGGLQLPPQRRGWAPRGIVAYSKICTHAGCAIALYRKPTFPVVEPHAALICPCHYSTFDPARGGAVLYGPAGRPLPQLPLMIDAQGVLRAAGNFSGPVGPSWWGVRDSKAQYD
jgi:ubiquinol-cytochrome c reductase iron-sulfur subunit